jgi:hypothetical protein
MTVKIYLRSIVKNGEKHLAMFDTNRQGDINNLTTDVYAGDKVIWKLDCCSGIKSITRIYSKEKEHTVFKSDPKKRFLCKGFKLQLEKGAEGKEKYTIECILSNNTELIIDPYIRVPPPDPSK